MQQYLISILQAGLGVADLVEVLSAIPCIPALEEVIAMRPEREWQRSMAICEFAAKAGHLEVLQWHFQTGAMDDQGAATSANAAAMAGNWGMLRWLLQHFSDSAAFQQMSMWRSYALGHIYGLPEQQALDQLLDLDDVMDCRVMSTTCILAPAGLQQKQGTSAVCSGFKTAGQPVLKALLQLKQQQHLDILMSCSGYGSNLYLGNGVTWCATKLLLQATWMC